MKKFLYIFLLLPFITFADEVTTSNLVNQTFYSNSTPTNGWSGNNTSNHGSGTIAGINNKYLEHEGISLKDDANMTEAQIQNGWKSEFGIKIWHWNTATSVTKMTQTITDSAGNVSTQIRNVTRTSCGYTNCGSYSTYNGANSTHTQGANTATDFDIAIRIDFDESTGRSSHWAPDVKHPTLKITYEENPVVVSQETVTQLEEASDAIEEAIELLDNQEIGGTTFTNMVENIIEDSGLDMTLVFETEMDMEEQMYFDNTIEVDTMEQTIDDEMAGVIVMEMPTDMEFDEPEMEIETIDMDMPDMTNMEMPEMDMEEPSFTEMAVETFETMAESFSQMFDMEMPEDMSTEAATEIMDAMVEMDMPTDMTMEETPSVDTNMEMEAPTDMVMEETPSVETETFEEGPVETVAMAEPEPEMEAPEAMEEEVVQSDEPVAMGEDDTMETSEPTMEENQPTEEVQSSENETVTTEDTPTESENSVTEDEPTTQEENTGATTETGNEPEETSQEGDSETETETVSDESSMDENSPSENTQTQEGGEETVVAEADTESGDTEVSETSSSVNADVDSIGDKVAKIIAKVNARLKKVSDRVRAVQVVTLKGMQMDGPNLNNYAKKSFYQDRQMNGVPNPDFFQEINILEQQQIYTDVSLATYTNNDPIAVQRSILTDINNKKMKLYQELRDLKGGNS